MSCTGLHRIFQSCHPDDHVHRDVDGTSFVSRRMMVCPLPVRYFCAVMNQRGPGSPRPSRCSSLLEIAGTAIPTVRQQEWFFSRMHEILSEKACVRPHIPEIICDLRERSRSTVFLTPRAFPLLQTALRGSPARPYRSPSVGVSHPPST